MRKSVLGANAVVIADATVALPIRPRPGRRSRQRPWGRLLRIAILAPALALAACASMQNGPAPIMQTIAPGSAEAKAILTAMRSDCLSVALPAAVGETSADRRNRLVTAVVTAVDIGYYDYERRLLRASQDSSFGSTLVSLGLSTLGGVVNDGGLSKALATINAGVTGASEALSREYLLKQTVTVLQTQMRANRAAARAAILERRGLGFDQWDSCMALSDALAFEQAGTLNAALASISASAATEEKNSATRQSAAVIVVRFDTSPLAVAFRDYLAAGDDDTVSDARLKLAADSLAGAGIRVPQGLTALRVVSLITSDTTRRADRRALVAVIAARETDAAIRENFASLLAQKD